MTQNSLFLIDFFSEQIISNSFDQIAHSFLQPFGKKRIWLKPNWVVGKSADTGVTTSIELISKIIKALRKIGWQEIIIGEGSLDLRQTERIFSSLGVNCLKENNISIINLFNTSRKTISVPNGNIFKKLWLPEDLLECDLLISIPKLKTHDVTGITLSVKNLFGLLDQNARKVAHRIDIHESLSEIYQTVKSCCALAGIIDAIIGLEGPGTPIHGTPIPLGMVIAGNNLIEVDVAGCLLMRIDHNHITHLKRLGANNYQLPQKIFEDLKKKSKQFDVAEEAHSKGGFSRWIKDRLFYPEPYQKKFLNCTNCMSCVRACPQNAIQMTNSGWLVEPKSCIHCLVCYEACEADALDHRPHNDSLFKLSKHIWKWNKKIVNLLR